MSNERCGTCHYHKPFTGTMVGICRRYPPTKQPADSARVGEWIMSGSKTIVNDMIMHAAGTTEFPCTGINSWCGEFKQEQPT